MTSKELRKKVRKFLDIEYVEGLRALYGTHDTATHLRDTLIALLDALDAEEAKGIVGYLTVPMPMWESPPNPSAKPCPACGVALGYHTFDSAAQRRICPLGAAKLPNEGEGHGP